MFYSRPVCPSCGDSKKANETKIVINLIESLAQNNPNWFHFFFDGNNNNAYKSFTTGTKWACDSCIEKSNALVASPSKQNFCDYLPFLAYFDSNRLCKSCDKAFVFKKEEQKYWYENLHFWVQSEAICCKSCRKEKRVNKEKIKNAQKRLHELMSDLNTTSEAELREVISLYQVTNSSNKVLKYTNALNKVISRKR